MGTILWIISHSCDSTLTSLEHQGKEAVSVILNPISEAMEMQTMKDLNVSTNALTLKAKGFSLKELNNRPMNSNYLLVDLF